jgi:hypothetical protein
MSKNITTTNGEKFTEEQSVTLAFLVWKRWGCDTAAAAVAWRRLFQNSCPDGDFEQLVKLGERLAG